MESSSRLPQFIGEMESLTIIFVVVVVVVVDFFVLKQRDIC